MIVYIFVKLLNYALNSFISAITRYNAPTVSQVAAIWTEGNDPQRTFDRSVLIYAKGERPCYIKAYHGCYDPLSYPLFFPRGETGWNQFMPYNCAPYESAEHYETPPPNPPNIEPSSSVPPSGAFINLASPFYLFYSYSWNAVLMCSWYLNRCTYCAIH